MKTEARKKKLFGISHPLGRAIICIAFVVLTGGIGLAFLLLGMIGDHLSSKKQKRAQ